MLDQPPNIPQAVIEYRNIGKSCDIYYVMDWDKYEIYMPVFKKKYGGLTGAPPFLIYDGKEVKMTFGDEYGFLHELKKPISLHRERPHQDNKD